jgi:hypothetical protein
LSSFISIRLANRRRALAFQNRVSPGNRESERHAAELESLEPLVEKVGRIALHAGRGKGLGALLNPLVRLKAADAA